MISFAVIRKFEPNRSIGWGRKLLAAYCALSMLLGPGLLHALPQNAQVKHGQIDINTQAGRMQIEQLSQMGIIDWQDFSIGSGERVDISQLNVDAALLNRVTGADPSKLYGQLNANGRVYVVNPNGVLIGPGARINTAEFIASTLDLADADFLNGGNLTFEGDSDASVVNLGEIKADNGDLILIAQVVENAGTLEAEQGTVALERDRKCSFSRMRISDSLSKRSSLNQPPKSVSRTRV